MRDDSLKRRTFLQSVGAAGMAGSLMAPALPAQSAGERRFRVGFIGTGRRGLGNMRSALRVPSLQVVAVCDVYRPNLDLAVAAVPGVKVC